MLIYGKQMRIDDFTDSLNLKLGFDLSEITDPHIMALRKLIPAPIISEFEITRDKDIVLKLQNALSYSYRVKVYIKNMLEVLFLHDFEKEEIEKAVFLLASSLKKEAEEKIATLGNQERIIMEKIYLAAIEAILANRDLSEGIAAVMIGLASIKKIDTEIQALQQLSQELKIVVRQKSLDMIENHEATKDLSPENKMKFDDFVTRLDDELDQNIQINRLFQSKTKTHVFSGLFNSFGLTDKNSRQDIIDYKTNAIYQKLPEFYRLNDIKGKECDSKHKDIIVNLVTLKDSAKQTLLHVNERVDELQAQRDNTVENIQSKMIEINQRENITLSADQGLDLFELDDMVESVLNVPLNSDDKNLRSRGKSSN